MSCNILVVNMGLKSIRSIIFDEEGNKLSSASRPLKTVLTDDFVMQDPDDWWENAICVIKESVVGLKSKKIDYITVTASSSCLICVGKENEVLYGAIMVSDKRAVVESSYINNCSSFQDVKLKTGVEVDSSFILPKILWIKNNRPDIYDRTYKFLTPNDYIISKLTGKYVTDYFNAQKYHYDCTERRYSEILLSELGISVEHLPRVVNIGTIVGDIIDKAANALNINKNAQVVVTTYDAICSFLGSGVANEGESADVSGTVTSFRTLSYKKDIKKSNIIFNQYCSELNMNIVGGSNNMGGGLIEWTKQCYYLNEKYSYEIMEKEAAESGSGAKGLIFLPYLLGERAPIWDSTARGVFFGLERFHTRKDMSRAVFESTGFVIKNMIEAIEETGVFVNDIRASGGLARINLISQLKADITGKNILILDEFETTAIGAAILTLIGVGIKNNLKEASKEFVSVRMIVKPNLKNQRIYDDVYKIYKETYLTLKSLFPRRKQLLEKIYISKESVIENL